MAEHAVGGQGADDAPPSDPMALDEWLRERLGRRMVVVVLRDAAGEAGNWQAAGASEIRVLDVQVAAADEREIERAVVAVAARDPDVVLVAEARGTDNTAAGRAWRGGVLAACERCGLCDRAFVALVGPEVSRQGARAQGYEDGIAAEGLTPAVLAALAREAAARDELRRTGSSPPCYL